MDGVLTPGVPIRTTIRIGACELKQAVGDDNRQGSPWDSTQVVVVANGVLSELDLLMDKVAFYDLQSA
jgi:hypothetical protein